MFQALAAYNQAAEYSRFGTEMALEAKHDLLVGKHLKELLTPAPDQTFSTLSQQLMLDIVLNLADNEVIDVKKLKSVALETSFSDKGEAGYQADLAKLKQAALVELKR
jgi:F0F1-type ATP synthase alpha subunit